jgi:hypothetical protein
MQVRMAQQQDLEGILALYRQLNPDDPVIDDGRDTLYLRRSSTVATSISLSPRCRGELWPPAM